MVEEKFECGRVYELKYDCEEDQNESTIRHERSNSTPVIDVKILESTRRNYKTPYQSFQFNKR